MTGAEGTAAGRLGWRGQPVTTLMLRRRGARRLGITPPACRRRFTQLAS